MRAAAIVNLLAKAINQKTNDWVCVAVFATLACIGRQARSALQLPALKMESFRRSAR
jgi:hypothetical protein